MLMCSDGLTHKHRPCLWLRDETFVSPVGRPEEDSHSHIHMHTSIYTPTHTHTYACQVRYLLEPLIDLVLAGERDLRRGLQVCWEAWCFGDRAAFYGSHCVFFLSKIWFGLLGGFSLTSSSPLDLAKMHLHTMFCSVTSYSNGCEYFLLSSWGSFFEWLLSGFRQDSDRRVQSW